MILGYFTELYNLKNKNYKNITFVQDNLSYSKKGVLRGLHFQLKNPQLKFITVIYGKIFDVMLIWEIIPKTLEGLLFRNVI